MADETKPIEAGTFADTLLRSAEVQKGHVSDEAMRKMLDKMSDGQFSKRYNEVRQQELIDTLNYVLGAVYKNQNDMKALSELNSLINRLRQELNVASV